MSHPETFTAWASWDNLPAVVQLSQIVPHLGVPEHWPIIADLETRCPGCDTRGDRHVPATITGAPIEDVEVGVVFYLCDGCFREVEPNVYAPVKRRTDRAVRKMTALARSLEREEIEARNIRPHLMQLAADTIEKYGIDVQTVARQADERYQK